MKNLMHTFKSAFKNVWYNKKQYVYFVILLIFIQSLLSCVILFNYNNNRNELRFLEDKYQITVDGESYKYHIALNNLTANQRADLYYYYNSLQDIKRTFHPVVSEEVQSGSHIRYNVYVYFSSETEPDATPYQLYEQFLRSAVFQQSLSEGVDVFETPYLQAYRAEIVNNSVTTTVCVVITVLGALAFGILFNTVVNHYKFSYGVYMTFGANFKKLLTIALAEMCLLNLFTFIPSFLLSVLIAFLLTMHAGYGISVTIYPMFLALLCSFVLTAASVTFVMKKLSLQTPDRLIRSVNNAGLITSPRLSRRLPKNGFPARTELLSMKRFRKYIATLMLTAMIFAGAFCGGIYMMQVQTQRENLVKPQFILSFPEGGIIHGDEIAEDTFAEDPSDEEMPSEDSSEGVEEPSDSSAEEDEPLEYPQGYTYTEDVRKTLYAIEGVDYIVKDRSISAEFLRSHVLIDSGALTLSGRMDGVSAGNGYSAFCNVDYKLLDEEVADNLLFLGATVSGDMSQVIDGERTVAISDSLNNSRVIKLKVGDTVKIAVSYKRKVPIGGSLPTSHKDLMDTLLKCYTFEYIDVKVGAIVSDLPAGDTFSVYMNESLFEEVTKTQAYFADVEIYCADGVSESTVRNIQTRLYSLERFYKMDILNTSNETAKVTEQMKNYPGIIAYISVLLLIVSVLIMVLNQSLFYQMRKQEFDTYLCLGANFTHIRKLFLLDAAFFSALSAICYSLFALLANAIVYKIVNINFGGAEARFSFHVPVGAFAIGLAASALSAFLSVMASYISFKRKSAPVFTGKTVDGVIDGTLDVGRSDIFDSDMR